MPGVQSMRLDANQQRRPKSTESFDGGSADVCTTNATSMPGALLVTCVCACGGAEVLRRLHPAITSPPPPPTSATLLAVTIRRRHHRRFSIDTKTGAPNRSPAILCPKGRRHRPYDRSPEAVSLRDHFVRGGQRVFD